jgi:hypothetical protein
MVLLWRTRMLFRESLFSRLSARFTDFVVRVSSFVKSEKGLKTQKMVWTQLLEQLELIHPGISQYL